MTAAGLRVFKTTDGRYVLEGDPDAAFLAYHEAQDVPADVLAELDTADASQGASGDEKAAPKPANKARRPAGDKSA